MHRSVCWTFGLSPVTSETQSCMFVLRPARRRWSTRYVNSAQVAVRSLQLFKTLFRSNEPNRTLYAYAIRICDMPCTRGAARRGPVPGAGRSRRPYFLRTTRRPTRTVGRGRRSTGPDRLPSTVLYRRSEPAPDRSLRGAALVPVLYQPGPLSDRDPRDRGLRVVPYHGPVPVPDLARDPSRCRVGRGRSEGVGRT